MRLDGGWVSNWMSLKNLNEPIEIIFNDWEWNFNTPLILFFLIGSKRINGVDVKNNQT